VNVGASEGRKREFNEEKEKKSTWKKRIKELHEQDLSVGGGPSGEERSKKSCD